jgi:hypothetical protein
MPTMSSYLLENMILDYYSTQLTKASQYVDIEIVKIFNDIRNRVFSTVNDPKGIQGDLNSLPYEDKRKISDRAYSDYLKAVEARNFEEQKNHRNSINKWREIFGDGFPKYE